MATNISRNTNTANTLNTSTINTNKNVIKEEKKMTNTINITTTPHKNKVELAKTATTTFLKLNDTIVGAIGGSQKEQDANVKCIQFMVDNCEANEDGLVLAQQCDWLTRIMADLEKASLDDTIVIDNVDYAVDTTNKKVYAENGEEVVTLSEIYPELINVGLTDEAVRAILIGELQKRKIAPVAYHEQVKELEEGEINIETEKKLSVFETIKGLRALGMNLSWFNIDGVRQPFPICYNGESDLSKFEKVVKDTKENDKSYLDVIFTSCRIKENDLDLDEEILEIEDTSCVIDYTKKEIWNEDVILKFADLSDIEYELPKEAIKVMLIERARTRIQELIERGAEYDDEDYDDDYDEYDDEWEF